MKKRTINPAELYDPKDDLLQELAETIDSLLKENTLLRDKVSIGQYDATEIERIDIAQTLQDLRKSNELLELTNKSLTESRNWYQNQVAQAISSRNYWEKQAKKLQKIVNQGGQNV